MPLSRSVTLRGRLTTLCRKFLRSLGRRKAEESQAVITPIERMVRIATPPLYEESKLKAPGDWFTIDDSEKDDEYDWGAEDEKPPDAKGYQRIRREESVLDLLRFRKMVWEEWDGHWWGQWRWTKWEDTQVIEQRIKGRRELAIRAWDAVRTPEEVLLLVIEQVVSSALVFAREVEEAARSGVFMWTPSGLGNLALVCRAWYKLIAPALYSKIWVEDNLLKSPLCHSLAQHARQITVRSARPFVTCARSSRSHPHPSPIVWLQWQGLDREDTTREGAAYHPTHALIYSHIHRSYSNVIALDLWRCTFLSSLDLLRLLASFATLERVRLYGISITRPSESIARPQRRDGSRLRFIQVDEHCKPPRLPFITRCWTWPHKASGDSIYPFYGLPLAEQRLVASISELVAQHDAKLSVEYHLDTMDGEDKSWIASVHNSSGPLVEFHAIQDDSRHHGSNAAFIHYCLLRARNADDARFLMDSSKAIGNAFAFLAYLETLVLETGHQLRANDVKSLLKVLHRVCRVEIQHRTSDKAHKLALEAMKSTTRAADAALLSPFWCRQTHARAWGNWLSPKYHDSLKAERELEDDPSHSHATPVLTTGD